MFSTSPLLILLSCLILINQCKLSTGQLTAQYLATTLPAGLPYSIIHYDGDDSIYIFGSGRNSDILKFSLSSETITIVGAIPEDMRGGSVQGDSSGNIFIFGGYDGWYSAYFYKFNPTTETLTLLTHLGRGITDHISFQYNSTIYFIGGDRSPLEFLGFDMVTESLTLVPNNFQYYVTQGAGVRFGSKVLIFDDTQAHLRRGMELDLDSFEMTPVGEPTLPLFSLWPSAVSDGRHAYIVGGYTPNWEATNGIIQYDPVTYENQFLAVDNWPVDGASFFRDAPSMIYVPGRNRIYFFGGYSYNVTGNWYKSHDEIFFVDLDPLQREGTKGKGVRVQ